ncbi:hypothetical protein GCM10011579_068170 [Streptomyces albiflavescens]|uniref:Peptidoglycan binding-like domain-containing protein n=1 Tax=Streptomyces albiflavescens TaxID=1623582 RepID=A0A917YAQ7_9ACTN|nr:neuraminidase-like domain-containing protein [Streptomyces albiflavescens]GGN81511.1 hypothetical protein GCM10011579_068170 [Streptomyces albiflavescens]
MNDTYRALSAGQSGDAVWLLQARLLDFGAELAHDELVEGLFGASTRHQLLALQRQLELPATGVADADTLRTLAEADVPHRGYVVGLVLGPDERPVSDVTLHALDRDLRSEQLLGAARSADDGFYQISYQPERSARLEQGSADVFVRALQDQTVLVDPPVEDTVFNAPPLVSITVRLAVRVAPERTEYEQVVATVEPLLGQLRWSELAEDGQHQDITFLTRETGLTAAQIEHVAVAQRLGGEAKIPLAFYYALFALDTLGAAQTWSSLIPRLRIGLGTLVKPLFYDIVLLSEEQLTAAVKQAVERFLVPRTVAVQLPEILGILAEYRDAAREFARSQRQRLVLEQVGHLLRTDVPDRVTALLAADSFGDLPGLFAQFRDLELAPSERAAEQAQARLALAELLGDDQTLIDLAQALHSIEGPEQLHRLARLEQADWIEVLRTHAATRDVPLTDEAAARQAALLEARMATRFPATAFASRLASDPSPPFAQAATVAELLHAHPEFDLATGNVTTLLAAHPELTSAPDGAAAVAALRTAQRVFRFAPHYAGSKALCEKGLTSAGAIQARGRERFVRETVQSGAFSAQQARHAHATAADLHAASLLLAGQLSGAASATTVASLAPAPAKLEPVTKDFPNMKSLFATADMSECSECRSVHGAAAYLVDVLEFLGNRLVVDTTATPAVVLKGARDVLFGRRPDLGVTDLNCANTMTAMPYLDLVCELLEDAVAPDLGIPFAGAVTAGVISPALQGALQAAGLAFTDQAAVFGPDLDGGFVVRDRRAVAGITPDGGGWRIRTLRQTFGTEAEVGAAPEYMNDAAYATLAASPFCFVLPFDLSHQETRRYFDQFDVNRAELMSRLQVGGNPSDATCAAERLGLSDAQRQLVVTPDVADQHTIWNTGGSPASATLSNVGTFVTRAGISYHDLLELLQLSWIDGGQNLFVQHLDSSSDLTQKRIANLDDSGLDRIHRFLRLRNATGWPSRTLDRAIRSAAGGGSVLDDACLVRLTRLGEVAQQLGLGLDATLDLLEPLSMTDPAGSYAATFLNPVASGSVDPRFLPAAVLANEAAEAAVPGSGIKLGAAAHFLGLALGTSPADTVALIALSGPDPVLTNGTISRTYAFSRIRTALHLTAPELSGLVAITGGDPLASSAALRDFADAAAAARASGLPIELWRYLLRHDAPDLASYDLSPSAAASLLGQLHDAYAAARAADASPVSAAATPEENSRAVCPFLTRLPGITDATVSRLQTLLDDAWTDPALSEANFVDNALAGYFDTTAIKAALAARQAAVPPRVAERNAVITAVGAAVSDYLYLRDRDAALSSTVATAMTIGEDLAAVLLNHAYLKEPAAAVTPTLHDVLIDDSGTSASADLQQRAVELLHTITLSAGKTGLPTGTVGWVLDHAAALGWLEWDHLPYRPCQPAAGYPAWRRLQGFFDLLDAYPDVSDPAHPDTPVTVASFFGLVLSGAAIADVLAYLARLTGTDPTVLGALDAHLGLSAPNLSAYQDPATVSRLLGTAALLRTLGLDVPTAAAVTQPVLTPADAASMRSALKSRYAAEEWLGVLQQIQDGLRPLKRDALVAYLLAVDPDLQSVDDLYDHFLIDVEMGSCMPTSRIVQAHATVQLFAMRCLMGLEPASVASVGHDDGWKQWDWMANFRVWEANRKIFLWPENWIEPELRDDKTELFATLDNDLQQDELTDLAVEDATGAYLERLDDIAHLDVMAAYYQTDRRVMHVFARTKGGSPTVYFHRQFQQERSWTPWTKVPLDITGDQLLAFDRNSRLTLAWPLFTEEPDSSKAPPDTPDPNSLSGGKSNDKPDKRWKIQLTVSEYAGGRWREKKVSQGALYTSFGQALPDQRQFNFFVWTLGATQAISCFSPSGFVGSFALTGCKGYPEPRQGGSMTGWLFPRFADTELDSGRFMELEHYAGGELAILQLPGQNAQLILQQTPAGLFDVAYPLQMTLIDWILVALEMWAGAQSTQLRTYGREHRLALPLGTLLPYFYGDYSRGYVITPGFYPRARERAGSTGPDLARTKKTASDVLRLIDDAIALLTKYLHKHQQNPGVPLSDLINELRQDPDYLKLVEEFQAFRKLRYGLDIHNFYHPLVCRFRAALNASGIPALMARDLQLTNTGFDFKTTYQPGSEVIKPYPREDVDFQLDGAYASYNWELFFHLPFDIARRLNQDQRFAAARDWYHYVFNPVGATDAPAPQRYWVTKPFFQTTAQDYLDERIDTILNAIAADPSAASIDDLAFAVSQWRDKPFKPDVVARSRPVAYQMSIVINYIQNLIDWGDSLFRQFTRESVNQATQLYILADKLLGPNPRVVPQEVSVPDMTYHQLRGEIDILGNALLDLENLIPDLNLLPHHGAELPPPSATLTSLYFCIPPNETLLKKWDVVADRLFKIRHCQNIDGIAASLALFAPPIDPGALVRAAAAGLDVSSFVAGLGAPPPHYRFSVMTQKASELTQQVASLGAELLSALEKRDAEQLARLRADQELAVLDSVREVKQAAIAESQGALEALKKSRAVIEERITFYSSQPFMNPWEITAVALNGASLIGESAVALGYVLAGGLKLIPNFVAGGAGFGGSPTVTVSTGGDSIGGAAETAVQVLSSLTRVADKAAGMASVQAGYQRRQDEWDFQLALAQKELTQMDQQITNAQLHLDMLAKDLATHDLQIRNSQQVGTFMRSKYTNQELYGWMIGQVSSVYFQAYKLAFDAAKKAESCYRYELANDTTFIRYGYWDSLKKGLMTAEALLHDIKRMETAYLDNNVREYELTKHLSLAQLDPGALLQLKTTGKVTIQVPEVAFDLDHPSHYARRIKTVSTSLVCNAGPYTPVGLTLSLVSNKYRKTTAVRAGAATDKDKYAEQVGSDDRFAYNVGSTASIATSSAVSDAGLFELNFHDERYLPFEGVGAISTWNIELPTTFQQFDPDTISDLILHIRYTAREGGSAFRTMVEKALAAIVNDTLLVAGRQGLYISFTLRDSFPNEWWQLTQTGQTTLTLGEQHLPYLARSHAPSLTSLTWAANVTGAPASYALNVDGTALTLNRDATMKSLCLGTGGSPVLGTPLTISADPAKLQDLVVLVHYTLS